MNRMMMRAAALCLATAFVAACGNKEAETTAKISAPTTPVAAVENAVSALKAGDLNALVQSQVPPKYQEKMRAEWKADLAKDPPTEEEKKEFADTMAKLTAADAEQKMMAELEPQLVKFETEYAPQMPMMIAFGQGMIQQGIKDSAELTESQKVEAGKMLTGMATWIQGVKISDRELAKKAVSEVVAAAREINLKTLDEARALEFDQAMQKSSIAFRAAKRVLAAYGFDMDKTLDTVKTELVAEQGDTAKVKVNFTMFDQPSSFETELVKLDGNWYGKQTIAELEKPDVEEPSEEAEVGAEGDATEGDASDEAPVEEEAEATEG
jgi:hypothetical protein